MYFSKVIFCMRSLHIIKKSAFDLATWDVVCMTGGGFSCAESSYISCAKSSSREDSLHMRLCI